MLTAEDAAKIGAAWQRRHDAERLAFLGDLHALVRDGALNQEFKAAFDHLVPEHTRLTARTEELGRENAALQEESGALSAHLGTVATERDHLRERVMGLERHAATVARINGFIRLYDCVIAGQPVDEAVLTVLDEQRGEIVRLREEQGKARAAIDQAISNLRGMKSLNDDPHIAEILDKTADLLFAALHPQEQRTITETFAKLRELVGDRYDGIDPVAYVAELRGGDEGADLTRLRSKMETLLISLGAIAADYPDDPVTARILKAVVREGPGLTEEMRARLAGSDDAGAALGATEPCLCCQESGCQFGCSCLTEGMRDTLVGPYHDGIDPASLRGGDGV